MAWWKNIAHLFSNDDENELPGEQEREEAEVTDEFTRAGGSGEGHFEEGVEMGTVPNTPYEYEGENTDEHPVVKPWWQFW